MYITKNKKFHSAFTLLELVIVITIIGVLMSLALPRVFKMIEFSYSTEAFSNIASIRTSVERCYLVHYDYDNCSLNQNEEQNILDIDDPAISPGAHFTYITDTTVNKASYSIKAIRNTLNTSNPGDTITYIYDFCKFANNKNKTELCYNSRSGTGVFSSIK